MDQNLSSALKALLDEVPVDIGGGCSLLKATMFAELIHSEDLKCTVDIGVYRGRSLLPQAFAHKHRTGGVAYGVDPWDSKEAVQHDVPEGKQVAVEEWTRATDLQRIYDDLVGVVAKHSLSANCTLIRMPSTDAAKIFEERQVWFDLIHIDGNHDRERVESDIALYLPRLRRGGYLVLDDIEWDSIRPAYTRLRESLSLVFELVDPKNEFAVYWNSRDPLGAEIRRLKLQRMGPLRGMWRRWRALHA